MSRRLLLVLVWLAATIAVVTAIGMRTRAARLADPRQALRGWLSDVPPEVSDLGRIVQRDARMLQVELRADPRWIRIFAQRNGFVPLRTELSGIRAERWMLAETKRPDFIAHILLPEHGTALVTISGP